MILKEMYHLSYDSSGFESGLVNWYNRLIDKTITELNVKDVSKMIRQDILREVAVKKAIDLFLNDPYDGEYEDGDLLNLLVSLELNEIHEIAIEKLKHQLKSLQLTYEFICKGVQFQYLIVENESGEPLRVLPEHYIAVPIKKASKREQGWFGKMFKK